MTEKMNANEKAIVRSLRTPVLLSEEQAEAHIIKLQTLIDVVEGDLFWALVDIREITELAKLQFRPVRQCRIAKAILRTKEAEARIDRLLNR